MFDCGAGTSLSKCRAVGSRQLLHQCGMYILEIYNFPIFAIMPMLTGSAGLPLVMWQWGRYVFARNDCNITIVPNAGWEHWVRGHLARNSCDITYRAKCDSGDGTFFPAMVATSLSCQMRAGNTGCAGILPAMAAISPIAPNAGWKPAHPVHPVSVPSLAIVWYGIVCQYFY